MASFNKVILVGNLTDTPELKKTPSGKSVCNFTLAVQRKFAASGQNRETDFIPIVAWNATAEFICRYFSKGKAILVCGSLQVRTWTDNNGQKRYTTEVVADEATFVENKGSSGGSPAPSPFENAAPFAPTYGNDLQGDFEELSDDDPLPF
jgi:single-strand DNA-binding protein